MEISFLESVKRTEILSVEGAGPNSPTNKNKVDPVKLYIGVESLLLQMRSNLGP